MFYYSKILDGFAAISTYLWIYVTEVIFSGRIFWTSYKEMTSYFKEIVWVSKGHYNALNFDYLLPSFLLCLNKKLLRTWILSVGLQVRFWLMQWCLLETRKIPQVRLLSDRKWSWLVRRTSTSKQKPFCAQMNPCSTAYPRVFEKYPFFQTPIFSRCICTLKVAFQSWCEPREPWKNFIKTKFRCYSARIQFALIITAHRIIARDWTNCLSVQTKDQISIRMFEVSWV